MRNTIVLEVDDVQVTDFDQTLVAPELIESREGGVTILFNDIDELKKYRDSLPSQEAESDADPKQNETKAKLITALNKVMRDNQNVLDGVKAFAQAIFDFIFEAEAHRKDKLMIFDTLIDDVRGTTSSWELETAIKDATFELGVPVFDHRLTFYKYAHNSVDYNFEKIKNRLIKDLLVLKVSLTD